MIGLQKKKDEEKAAAAAAAAAVETSTPEAPPPAAPGGRGRGAVNLFIKKDPSKASSSARRMKPGEIRVQKDVAELDGGDCVETVFPNPNDLMKFSCTISPNEGFWAGYSYTFNFVVPDHYPHEAPKVHCMDKIYHPNIDLEGNVCLNVLRADWKPVLDLNTVIYGLIVLFHTPNPDDPLNGDAAKMLRDNLPKFKQNVEKSLRGMEVDGSSYPPGRKKF